MFDDFDDTASFLDDLEEEDSGLILDDVSAPPRRRGRRSRSSGGFLGLTGVQGFIISAMIFFQVGIIGFFFMLVTQKMVIR